MTTQARFEEIKALVIAKIQTDPFYSYFSEIDPSVLDQAFDNGYEELSLGIRDIIDQQDNVTGNNMPVYFFSNLTCAYMFAFTLKPYLVEKGGKWIIEDPGALPSTFRTISSQSMDAVSVVFESERLGIKIDTPLEQWLSVTSWGFRCIQHIKDYALRKGRVFIC